VLSQEFAEVWIAGKVGETEIEALRKALLECARRGRRRLRFRFYLNPREGLSYIEALRRVLLENVSMSIVVEERPIDELPLHAEKLKGEVLMVVGGGVGEIVSEALKNGGGKLRLAEGGGR